MLLCLMYCKSITINAELASHQEFWQKQPEVATQSLAFSAHHTFMLDAFYALKDIRGLEAFIALLENFMSRELTALLSDFDTAILKTHLLLNKFGTCKNRLSELEMLHKIIVSGQTN